MATLEKIRSKAGLLIFIIAFALLCFIVGDFLTNSTSFFHRNQTVVAEVNGVELSNIAFDESYQEIAEMAKATSQQGVDDNQLRLITLQTFKRNTLFQQEAEADGLTVTKDELTDATVGDHPSPILYQTGFFTNQQGMFDKSLIARLIENVNRDPNSIQDENQRMQFMTAQESQRKIWFYLEGRIKNNLLENKVNSMVANALTAPKAEADYLASLSSKEYDALVTKKLYADVDDASIKIDDAELKAYYDKNKDYKFKSTAFRNLKFIDFIIAPSAADFTKTKAKVDSLRSKLANTSKVEDLQLLFESSSDDAYPLTNVYRKPSDRTMDRDFVEFAKTATKGQVSEVVTDQQQGVIKVAKAIESPVRRPDSIRVAYIVLQANDSLAAQHRADSVAAVVRAGSDFAKLASSISLDKRGANANWMQEGMIGLKDFDDKAFSSKPGSVLTFVQDKAAFIFKIDSATAPVLKAKVAVLANRLVASSATVDSLTDLVQKYIDANPTAKQFADNGPKSNMAVRPIDNLKADDPYNPRCIIKWAFDEERQEGDVSDVITDVPNHICAVALSDIADCDNGVAPFEKVKDQIKSILLTDKKAEKLMGEMKGKQLAEIGKVDSVNAVRFFSSFVPNEGNEPALVGAITSAKVNTLSAPVKGRQGVFMFQKTAERQSSLPAMDKNAINSAIYSSVRNLQQSLEDKADIEDNSLFFF